ncbi:MAG: hypothetical protein V4689_07635 [Verrucomicrobiota bacterium]
MNNENIRVSLAFARGNAQAVEGAGYTVLSKLYTVPELPNPPVTEVMLDTSCKSLTASRRMW